tara:strand:+ start:5663 stop:6919 length:1257 start_codon:yes stop_codon:yes gene_type:complete
MSYFEHKGESLFSEKIEIEKIAEQIETPFYCYSINAIKKNIFNFKSEIHGINEKICFALKANSNLSILKVLKDEGLGADVVSIGEFKKSLKVGIGANDIVFSGVGKSDQEIEFAIKEGCFQINAESISEIKRINEISHKLNYIQNIGIRINPDVKPDTHSKITTGLIENKFGIPIDDVKELYAQSNLFENININGIAFHIGSQIMELNPFEKACKIAKELIDEIETNGISVKTVDVGGGIGISDSEKFRFNEYFALVKKYLANPKRTIIFEPGRSILGNAGIIVSKVIYIKESKNKNFIIIDAGMNNFIRPALYNASHPIVPLIKNDIKNNIPTDIVGPICESSDRFLTLDNFQKINEGDFLAIKNVGAYGSSMSSNYNVRPRIEEILIDKDKFYTINKKEEFDEMIRNESDSDYLKS